MKTVRFGIIGLGNMGSAHAKSLGSGAVAGAALAAVCDIDPARLAAHTAQYPCRVLPVIATCSVAA